MVAWWGRWDLNPRPLAPIFSESPAPQGHRPYLDSGILWAGLNPLDQARRRPPLLRLNLQLFYLSIGRKITALIALTVA